MSCLDQLSRFSGVRTANKRVKVLRRIQVPTPPPEVSQSIAYCLPQESDYGIVRRRILCSHAPRTVLHQPYQYDRRYIFPIGWIYSAPSSPGKELQLPKDDPGCFLAPRDRCVVAIGGGEFPERIEEGHC